MTDLVLAPPLSEAVPAVPAVRPAPLDRLPGTSDDDRAHQPRPGLLLGVPDRCSAPSPTVATHPQARTPADSDLREIRLRLWWGHRRCCRARLRPRRLGRLLRSPAFHGFRQAWSARRWRRQSPGRPAPRLGPGVRYL